MIRRTFCHGGFAGAAYAFTTGVGPLYSNLFDCLKDRQFCWNLKPISAVAKHEFEVRIYRVRVHLSDCVLGFFSGGKRCQHFAVRNRRPIGSA